MQWFDIYTLLNKRDFLIALAVKQEDLKKKNPFNLGKATSSVNANMIICTGF